MAALSNDNKRSIVFAVLVINLVLKFLLAAVIKSYHDVDNSQIFSNFLQFV
jgi:hypothetical protein